MPVSLAIAASSLPCGLDARNEGIKAWYSCKKGPQRDHVIVVVVQKDSGVEDVCYISLRSSRPHFHAF